MACAADRIATDSGACARRTGSMLRHLGTTSLGFAASEELRDDLPDYTRWLVVLCPRACVRVGPVQLRSGAPGQHRWLPLRSEPVLRRARRLVARRTRARPSVVPGLLRSGVSGQSRWFSLRQRSCIMATTIRGGSWWYHIRFSRAAHASSIDPRNTDHDVGFRCVRSLPFGVRGGSWDAGLRWMCASHRLRNDPAFRGSYVGLRCVRGGE